MPKRIPPYALLQARYGTEDPVVGIPRDFLVGVAPAIGIERRWSTRCGDRSYVDDDPPSTIWPALVRHLARGIQIGPYRPVTKRVSPSAR
jgi:hypothetical protein